MAAEGGSQALGWRQLGCASGGLVLMFTVVIVVVIGTSALGVSVWGRALMIAGSSAPSAGESTWEAPPPGPLSPGRVQVFARVCRDTWSGLVAWHTGPLQRSDESTGMLSVAGVAWARRALFSSLAGHKMTLREFVWLGRRLLAAFPHRNQTSGAGASVDVALARHHAVLLATLLPARIGGTGERVLIWALAEALHARLAR